MGKKYDAYAKAAQAESQTLGRYQAEIVGGNQKDIEQARTDYNQARSIADVTYGEFTDDVEG